MNIRALLYVYTGISRERKTDDLIVAAKQTAHSHTHTLTCTGAPSDTSVYYNVLLGAE